MFLNSEVTTTVGDNNTFTFVKNHAVTISSPTPLGGYNVRNSVSVKSGEGFYKLMTQMIVPGDLKSSVAKRRSVLLGLFAFYAYYDCFCMGI